jgi:hypothetical protein
VFFDAVRSTAGLPFTRLKGVGWDRPCEFRVDSATSSTTSPVLQVLPVSNGPSDYPHAAAFLSQVGASRVAVLAIVLMLAAPAAALDVR